MPLLASDHKPILDYFPSSQPRFECAKCSCHLALQDELVSKSFSGRDGPAYLLRSVINTDRSKEEDKMLMTGWHTISNLSCKGCSTPLGWTYVKAFEASQRYKEGKSILEKDKIFKENAWSLSDESQ